MATLDDFAKQKADYFKQKRQEQLGQVNAAAQEQQDVIQRRFAALGAQGSGAQFGIQQKSAEQAAAQRRNVEQDILGQQIAAAEPDLARRFAAEQAQLGREFGTQERLGSEKFQTGQLTQQQQFAAEQAGLGRQFQTQERVGSQQFAGEQAGLGRQFTAAEREAQQAFAAEQAKLGREFTTAERLAQQVYGSDEAGKARQFQAGQQQAQNLFASGEAALGRQFSAEERAAQNKFLAGESAASRDLQSRLAADDLALKKSIADLQNANTKEELDLAKRQFLIDKDTTDFNKYVSLVTMGFSRIDAQNMAFSNVGPAGPLPTSQISFQTPAQSPAQSTGSQQPIDIAAMQPTEGFMGVPTLPPLPEYATQQQRFEYQKKQEDLINAWAKTAGSLNLDIYR